MVHTENEIGVADITSDDDLVTYYVYGIERYKTYVFQPKKVPPVPDREFILLFEVTAKYTGKPLYVPDTVPVPGGVYCTNDHKRIEVLTVEWI